MRPSRETKTLGFTLLEMSIVLVVVALIVGGIVGGEGLVKTAEMRHLTGKMSEYRTAFLAFRDKFGYPPGDLPNATAIWGAANADANTCGAAVGTPGVAGTCNGNGDGLINRDSDANKWLITAESYLAWQHLGLAGQTDKTLSGKNPYWVSTIDDNSPNLGYGSTTADFKDLIVYYHDGNALRLYTTDNATTSGDDQSVLSIQESRDIDTKLDDGHANSGRIYASGIGSNGGDSQCTGADANSWGSDYLSSTANPSAKCTVTWWME